MRLGREQAQVDLPPAPPAVASALGAALAGAGALVYRPVTVQVGAGVPARMRLLGHDEEIAATVAFGQRLAELAIGDVTPLTADVIEQERARQYLMRAVFDQDGVTPIGTAEEWGHASITAAVIHPLWIEYADLRSAHDPCAEPLPDGDVAMIARAVEKKSARFLIGCGSITLVRWLLTTGAQPAASPTPRSSPSSDSDPTTT